MPLTTNKLYHKVAQEKKLSTFSKVKLKVRIKTIIMITVTAMKKLDMKIILLDLGIVPFRYIYALIVKLRTIKNIVKKKENNV